MPRCSFAYAKVQRFFETTKCLADFYQFNQKNPAGLAALRDERYVKEMYLETTDYQLFAVYTVEKWIGICLKGCGCYDFSFECSRVVRPASRLRESLMHEGQPRGIRRRVTASWRACHCLEI